MGTLVTIDEAKCHRIDHLDSVAGLIDQIAKQLQRLVNTFSFGNVLRNSSYEIDFALGVSHRE